LSSCGFGYASRSSGRNSMPFTFHWTSSYMRLLCLLILLFGAPVAAQSQQPAPQPQQQEEFVPVSQLPPQDQLPAAPLLVTAYSFVWIVLFGYVVSVARRLSKVQHEVDRLESDMKRSLRS